MLSRHGKVKMEAESWGRERGKKLEVELSRILESWDDSLAKFIVRL